MLTLLFDPKKVSRLGWRLDLILDECAPRLGGVVPAFFDGRMEYPKETLAEEAERGGQQRNAARTEAARKGNQTSYRTRGKKDRQEVLFPELEKRIEKKRAARATSAVWGGERRRSAEFVAEMRRGRSTANRGYRGRG